MYVGRPFSSGKSVNTRNCCPLKRRQSPGTISPVCKSRISPTTTRAADTRKTLPSRKTRTTGVRYCVVIRESSSQRYKKRTNTAISKANKTTVQTICKEDKKTTASSAPKSIKRIAGSSNILFISLFFLGAVSSNKGFLPCFLKRERAALRESPQAALVCKCWQRDTGVA